MAQIEVYKTVTVGGSNFMSGSLVDDKVFGKEVARLKKLDLIGPITKATKDRLEAEKKANEKPVRERTDEDKKDPDAGGGNDNKAAIIELLAKIEEPIRLKATWLFEAIDKLMKDGDEPVTTELVLLICEGVTTKKALMEAVDAYLDKEDED